MYSIFKNLILLTIVFASLSSHAKLLIEPLVGTIVKGGLANDITSANDEIDSTFDYTGVEYGLKLAILEKSGLFGGIDYRISSFSINKSYTLHRQVRPAILIGYDTGNILRFWFNYGFQSTLEISNPQVEFKLFNDYTIGLGFKVYSDISINFEFNNMNSREVKSNEPGVETKNAVNIDLFSQIVSISYPFEF